ncbi:dihydroorotate dehydrogenase [Peptostreptococcus canis]|uniref:Dihydroorotate dehydrogenase n=1 Tax=Peptostreptococcus canis TaxID=1159213 RepID=A0ABR6TLN6_9FIRM|nr:dihydroorotate dehydrogenase [Peptostreptococcus canis]MBC2576336.1 dihydroorotate dehydrogenase [Peptostreptococcus canis]MBP1998535.1 dihydroorotate dehydrogenase (NAD+) catalytic subunit [Peptostreptococcus canis]
MADLRVKLCGIELKNPIIMASGTFGFGKEYGEIYNINKLGGISSKGLTFEKRNGNDGMRVYETPSGMMNSVGLENPGVKGFIENELPDYSKLNTCRIVNLGGGCEEDYVEGAKLLDDKDFDILELNISCPNVKHGGMAFGIKSEVAREVVKAVRKATTKPLVVKLSPNAEDIVEMAKVCEEEGADGISLVNTFKAMAIDIENRRPVFNNITAGLSGPAIKPIALRMVYEVSKAVKIPVIGMGGIMNAKDVVEFIMAGASCIQIGTANFVNPRIGEEIIEELEKFMDDRNIKSLDEIRGII